MASVAGRPTKVASVGAAVLGRPCVGLARHLVGRYVPTRPCGPLPGLDATLTSLLPVSGPDAAGLAMGPGLEGAQAGLLACLSVDRLSLAGRRRRLGTARQDHANGLGPACLLRPQAARPSGLSCRKSVRHIPTSADSQTVRRGLLAAAVAFCAVTAWPAPVPRPVVAARRLAPSKPSPGTGLVARLSRVTLLVLPARRLEVLKGLVG